MKITIISLNYYPEDTAIGLYSTQMAEFLVQNGWTVTVITGFPYYPEWKIHQGYEIKKKYLEEQIQGVRILRFQQFVPSNPTFLKRIIHILDFTSGSLTNLKKIEATDVVLSIIPFTSSAWLGKKLAKRLHAKHWIHIQDFEFDAAIQSGIAAKKVLGAFLPKILFNLESSLLKSANITSTISETMMDKLKDKTNTKTFLFPNWIDSDSIDPKKANTHPFLKAKSLKILYSGNIGLKQDWDFFEKVVNHFEKQSTIEFIVAGDGAKRTLIENLTHKLKNLTYHPNVPYNQLNDLLCSADLHIFFQKKDVTNAVMPSKILGMLASGKPSIVTGNMNSEVAKIIQEANAGNFYDSSDLEGVIEGITFYNNQFNFSPKNNHTARNYIIQKFAKNNVLASFLKELNKLAHG
jgi:colanic acid biosynthesis glycosyl transferase WcaI